MTYFLDYAMASTNYQFSKCDLYEYDWNHNQIESAFYCRRKRTYAAPSIGFRKLIRTSHPYISGCDVILEVEVELKTRCRCCIMQVLTLRVIL